LLVGGASLLLDSCVNFAIQLLPAQAHAQCILGILTTVTNYYAGWVCIALRAYRVKAVFDVYDWYLQLLQKQDQVVGSDESDLLQVSTSNMDETEA
jgi:hypothetical protein